MPGGDEGIHLHASEAATVEDERLTPRVLDLHHLPQHEVVIPGRDRLHHRAAEDSCCTENDQEPVWAPADMLRGKRRASLGEVDRRLALTSVQDADREASALGCCRQRSRPVAEADEHERRLEGD